MGRLVAPTFATLGGIMQAPGGPGEDPTGGFTLGGRKFDYWDEAVDLSAVIALKAQPGPELQIIGSGNLMQTLQAASLIAEYNVWTSTERVRITRH